MAFSSTQYSSLCRRRSAKLVHHDVPKASHSQRMASTNLQVICQRWRMSRRLGVIYYMTRQFLFALCGVGTSRYICAYFLSYFHSAISVNKGTLLFDTWPLEIVYDPMDNGIVPWVNAIKTARNQNETFESRHEEISELKMIHYGLMSAHELSSMGRESLAM
jgi:hypothetical protein